MDRRTFSTVLILLGSFFLLEVQSFRQPECGGKETKLSPEELKMMTDCVKEFSKGGTNFADIPKDSMGCVGKCILQREGLVDESGKPQKENIFKMVNATLEPELAKLADEKLGKCIDDNSSGIDANEKACSTYWPLVQCVAAAFMEICADPKATTEKA